MAKIATVKEILDPDQYADGQVVMAIEGTLAKLYDEKKGGDWCFQNGVFKDATGEIKIVFSKCSQPTAAKGRKLHVESVKSEQHGWLGIKVKDSTFEKNGEQISERQITITPSAKLAYEGGAAPAKEQGKPGTSASAPATRSTTHPEEVLKDIIELHVRCKSLVTEKYGVDHHAEYVAQVFIQATRENLHMDYMKRAAAPVPKHYPPPPSDPNEWAQCVIPKGEYEGKTLKELPDEKLLELFSVLDSKGSNTPFAECVYQAARDRDILPKSQPKEPEKPEQPEDDIPF